MIRVTLNAKHFDLDGVTPDDLRKQGITLVEGTDKVKLAKSPEVLFQMAFDLIEKCDKRSENFSEQALFTALVHKKRILALSDRISVLENALGIDSSETQKMLHSEIEQLKRMSTASAIKVLQNEFRDAEDQEVAENPDTCNQPAETEEDT